MQASWTELALVLKISAILLKYPTFEGGYFIFSWGKKYKIRICSVSTKKLITIKVRNLLNFASKNTILVQNRIL